MSSVAHSGVGLRWGVDGGTAVRVSTATTCTLTVHFDTLPEQWWLLWRGTETAGTQVGKRPSGRAMTIEQGGLRLPQEPRTWSVYLEDGLRTQDMAYVIEADSADRLDVIAVAMERGPDPAHTIARVSETCSINGGSAGRWPPTAFSASYLPREATLVVRGWGLDHIAGARATLRHGSTLEAGTPAARQGDRVEFRMRPGTVGLARVYLKDDELGWIDSIGVVTEPSVEADPRPAYLSVWFYPGVIGGDWSANALGLESFAFPSPVLRELLQGANVLGLRRLHRDSIPMSNALGERVLPVSTRDVYVLELGDSAAATGLGNDLVSLGLARVVSGPRDGRPHQHSPNDPLFENQWHLHLLDPTIPICNGWFQGPGAHLGLVGQYGRSPGDGPDVALLDTGVDDFHEDLGWYSPYGIFTDENTPLDLNGHGCANAGLICAATDNGVGMAATAPGSRAWSFKVLERDGEGEWAWVNEAIGFSTIAPDRKFPLVSMSLGAPGGPGSLLGPTCRNARVAGQLLVAPMGMTDEPVPIVPSRLDASVCAVGAQWITGFRWTDDDILGFNVDSGSNTGPSIDLCAPGGRAILTADIGGSPPYFDNVDCPSNVPELMPWGGGTSAAAAIVTGAATLVLQENPLLLGEDIQRALEITAFDILPPGWDDRHGYGRVDPVAAIALVGVGSHLVHDVIRAEALTIDSAATLESRTFRGVVGIADGVYQCRKYRLAGVAGWNIGAVSAPFAWTRTSGTIGWRDSVVIDNYEDAPYARVVGPIQTTSMFCETYTFRIMSSTGAHLAWFPAEPNLCQIAYTVLGAPGTVGVMDEGAPFAGALEVRNLLTAGRAELVLRAAQGDLVRLEIMDVLGRRVTTLHDGPATSEEMKITWDGRDGGGARVPPGVYLVRMVTSGRSHAGRAVLIR